ncbi:hypothetical protein L6452_41277 [Arctium lappa]|uniref:Uncharacterized protein n=1 Tax=Arctium lappa TaxID=4217 RepID=A0ACB8XQF4_ARCLA|nr:hypothetical protein L6452_41277 [Arctium lappa]
MHKKSIAKKPRKAWDFLSYWRATVNIPDFQMSSEPVSMFKKDEHLDYFKKLAKIPDGVNLVTPEDLKPDEVPMGYSVLYEYLFKIGFSWPFSPLVREFLDAFDLTPGQLMPQFWRIVQVASVSDEDRQWLSSGWNESVIDFSRVKPRKDSLDKIQRILDRNAAVKSAAAKRAEQLELARQGREKARKRSAPSTGVDPRRVRGKQPRYSPKKTGDTTLSSLSGATLAKDTVAEFELEGSTKATKDAPLSGVSGVEKPSSSSKGQGKNKEKVGEMTFKATLPADFMVNDVLERDVIFPHLAKFLLPTFYDRYKDSRVEDTGAHAAGISFMAFQACLSFYAQTEGFRASFPDVKKRADETLEREKVALEAVEAEKKKVESLKTKLVEAQSETIKFRDHVLELEALTSKMEVEKIKATTAAAASADEVMSLKKKVEEMESDVRDLEEENRQIEVFSRLTARAALMRRHMSGKNPMVSAAEELKTYLDTVGTERDLDEDADLEGSDGGGEVAVAGTAVMQERSDVTPS